MGHHKKAEKMTPTNQFCSTPFCFFCIMKEQEPTLRRAEISTFFKQMAYEDIEEKVVPVSGIWNIAMTRPDDPEFPSLGIFECMANLINKGVNGKEWLLSDQNVYIPYYAAHIIGSYTMNRAEFAERAVQAGVIAPLMELLRAKISWVEQRVAVRALGHLASYETTFLALEEYEEELVRLAMHTSSTCLEVVYNMFVAINDRGKRPRYQSDLLTRGIGGMEIENRKAEEWASQLQCWSLYLLNCFACKEKSLHLICRPVFLRNLCSMWGGLVNDVSPAGYGLIRILCYSKYGRRSIAELREVIEALGNLSRSSDDWQYIGVDCLLLLLKDEDTRNKVIDVAIDYLVDLIELKTLGGRSNVGQTIINTLLLDGREGRKSKFRNNGQKGIEEVRGTIERRRREKAMPEEKVEEMRVLVSLVKQQGNQCFCKQMEATWLFNRRPSSMHVPRVRELNDSRDEILQYDEITEISREEKGFESSKFYHQGPSSVPQEILVAKGGSDGRKERYKKRSKARIAWTMLQANVGRKFWYLAIVEDVSPCSIMLLAMKSS
ncbi:hypothetical protein Cgig2_008180 [Carnegiea gigantea]|uniref:ARM repeat N-terminal plant domain-containing protein n=1 Tax=Carnegiea gigantea TaxID=171969 RepID=A0A9Q1KYT2_9CARY|nr:hypothetical protein Cgig2_008180 [Carnegiea gigantea]